MSEPHFDILPSVLNGDTADVYFRRTDTILAAEGIDPLVDMEIFGREPGILCGVKETCQLLRQAGFAGELWALNEGDEFAAKETAMRIV
ncbi:MAG TPA: nicotinate phosphoribosyltransferase, partial [Chloroflexota bacterium]|nr:nicotinate phosphoribosyltransferase [Chloroflexota bacterium]